MAVKLKTWIWIVVGLLGLGVFCIVAMAGAGFYFFSQHFDTKVVSREGAGTEFEHVRAQFTGHKALIELDESLREWNATAVGDGRIGVGVRSEG